MRVASGPDLGRVDVEVGGPLHLAEHPAAWSDSMSSVSRKTVRTEMPERSAICWAVGASLPDSIRSRKASTARS